MKRIQVLGPGCPKCEMLARLSKKAAEELGLEYKLEEVRDINAILRFRVMMTPALVVNGKVKAVGRVPSLEELKKLLRD